jgi:pimeloyl-ACP methyl ester carboxylesterase
MKTGLQTTTFDTSDGRELCVEIAGEGGSRTVLLCAGTPNSRRLYHGWVEDAQARGARLVGYDRPGYGGSTPKPGYSVADGAEDIRTIAQALGVERLVVWGFSGGGPFVLACAALLEELVAAAATVGSPAPWRAPGLDYFTGMGEDNVNDIELYLSDPEAARRKSSEEREQLLGVTAEQLTEAWKTLLSPVDAEALKSDFAAAVVESLATGLEPGDHGWWDDTVASMSPWGFELDSISVPVKVWHGRQDRFVPFQHGQWLAEHIPGAEAALSETEGHLSLLINGVGDVHEWLLSHL